MNDVSNELFMQAQAEYKQRVKHIITNIEKTDCNHEDQEKIAGTITCNLCGLQLVKGLTQDQEWRNYGITDGKKTSDPNRVQQRKLEERSIHRDVENLDFSDNIVAKAEEIYQEVTKGQIFRGGSRKAIIFACLFHAYKILGTPQSHEHLINILGLTRRTGLRGIKFVNIHAPKDSQIHSSVITPSILIRELMNKFKAQESHIKEVTDIYKLIHNRSSKLNRARPQSVSAGLVYYWIRLKMLDISIKDFARIAELSVLTIDKIAREISIVLQTPKVLT